MIAIVILAAGASSRMGRPKQLLQYEGQTLLKHTIQKAKAVNTCRVFVVLGAHAEAIRPTLQGTKITIVDNPDWSAGMGSSIRCGLQRAMAEIPSLEAAVILLVDQPLLSSAHIGSLIRHYQASKAPVVASAYEETVGVPALFHCSLFEELINLDESTGAKTLIHRYSKELEIIEFRGGHLDVDTPADWRNWI